MATAQRILGLARRVQLWLAECFSADLGRRFLWSPVFMGAGAALYLQLPVEPALGPVLAGTGAIIFIGLIARRSGLPGLRLLAAALALCAIGFCAGKLRTIIVAAPMIQGSTGPVTVAGRVIGTELADRGTRILMDRLSIDNIPLSETPERIRIRLTKYSAVPMAGSDITIKASIASPPGPAEPGAHDFRRDSFFAGIGGVGYALGYPAIIRSGTLDGGEAWLEQLRQQIGNRLIAVLGKSPETAIATAYLTGERGLIDEQSATDMRGSGLAHLLAISGMKVGLVAVLVFGAVRGCLSLLPAASVRWPTRKIAAAFGIAAAIAYTGLAASPVPALRSVLMTSMGMLAIIFDRQSFSLRLAAIAAMIVILWQPESVASVSFQMSFGAVIALISFYEAFREVIAARYRHSGRLRRFALNLGKIVLTTFIATLVTAPLALIHFQQEANYSIAANAIAIPLNDVWIMPSAILAMLLMPFGLDALPLRIMGQGIHLMLAVAQHVSAWPGAVTHVPYIGDASLVLLGLGGLWIVIWRSRWRRLGLVPVAFGIALAGLHHAPDILVSEDGTRVAFRMQDGTLAVSKETKHDFTDDNWDKLNGSKGVQPMPVQGSLDKGALNCDAVACYWIADGQSIILLRDAAGAAQACAPDAIVITGRLLQVNCPARLVIDPVYLQGKGALAIRLTPGGNTVTSVALETGERPWSIRSSAADRSVDPEP